MCPNTWSWDSDLSVATLERRVLGEFGKVLGQQRSVPTPERRVKGDFRKSPGTATKRTKT